MKKTLFLALLLASSVWNAYGDVITPDPTPLYGSTWTLYATFSNITETSDIKTLASLTTTSYANLDAVGYTYQNGDLTIYFGGFASNKNWNTGETITVADYDPANALSLAWNHEGTAGHRLYVATTDASSVSTICPDSFSNNEGNYSGKYVLSFQTGSDISGNFYGNTAAALSAQPGVNLSSSLFSGSAYTEDLFMRYLTSGNLQAPPYQSTTDTTLGRIMFMGDSITNGISDATYRWQFFKILVDNGIENEISGPLSGETSGFPANNTDFSASGNNAYGSVAYADKHYAKSSGRSYEMISGSRYGMTVEQASAETNADTHFLMIGTNDLLSDTVNGTAGYVNVMQRLLGETVAYDAATNSYSWSGTVGGTMKGIADSVLKDKTDTLYVFSVPTWGTKGSHSASDHTAFDAVEQYNGLLEQWVEAYNAQSEATARFVDINRGLVDVAQNRWIGYDGFYRQASGDYLHPNEQGSLIIAGNLAQQIGIGGRTAGLVRSDVSSDSGWSTVGNVTLGAVGETVSVGAAAGAFSYADGYTVDFRASYGDGSLNGWTDASNSLSITVGDGVHSGTLNLAEGYIMWGDKVLFCQDNSAMQEHLRIAWHNGNAEGNIGSGYYVWLGDMLIGQALQSAVGEMKGIGLSWSGEAGTAAGIFDLAFADTAYAPATTGTVSSGNAYLPGQDAARVSHGIDINSAGDMHAYAAGGKTYLYGVTTTGSGANARPVYDANLYDEAGKTVTAVCRTTPTGTFAALAGDSTFDGNINIVIDADQSANKGVWGVYNTNANQQGRVTGDVLLLVDNADVTLGSFTAGGATASVVGANKGAIGGTYSFILAEGALEAGIIGGGCGGSSVHAVEIGVEGGSVGGNVCGGSVGGDDTVGSASVAISGGSIAGSVYGGGTNGTITGDTNVTISGGAVNGSVYGGGDGDAIGGSTGVTISGGTVNGSVYGGSASGMANGPSYVTIEGTGATIGGDIAAQNVTLRKMRNDAQDAAVSPFVAYSGSIGAEKLVLDDVAVSELSASFNGVKGLEAANGTATSILLGETSVLDKVTLRRSSVCLRNEANGLTKVTIGDLASSGASALKADVTFTLNASVVLGDTLSLGGGSMTLTSIAVSGALADGIADMGDGTTKDLFRDVSTLNFIGADGQSVSLTETDAKRIFSADEAMELFGLALDDTYTLSYSKGAISLLKGEEAAPLPPVEPDKPEPALAKLALTRNGKAGAALLDNAAITAGGDVAAAYAAILMSGNRAEADRVMSAVAGASIATLGAAFSGDVERQLRAIRNRTTTMGVDPACRHDGLPTFNAWVNAEGDYRKTDQDGTASGYTLSSWGGTLGFDVDMTPRLTMGMAFTAMYGDFDARGADTAKGDFDTYYVSLFARYASHAWMHTFVGTLGRADISLDRTVSYVGGGYKAAGDTNGLGFGLMYEAGYVVPLNEERTACLQPVFNVTWRHAGVDGYSESGSDAALQAGRQTLDVVTFGLGARVQAAIGENVYNRTSIFEARALLKADAGDRSSEADVAFLHGAGAANVESAEIGAFGVELGAGLTVPVGADGGALFMDASVELRGSYSNFNGTVGYRVNF